MALKGNIIMYHLLHHQPTSTTHPIKPSFPDFQTTLVSSLPYRSVAVGGESQELFERTGDGGKEKQTPNDTERTLKAFPRAGVAGRAVEFDITFHSLESFHRSFHQRFIPRL